MSTTLLKSAVEFVPKAALAFDSSELVVRDEKDLRQLVNRVSSSRMGKAIRAYSDGALSLILSQLSLPTGTPPKFVPFTTNLAADNSVGVETLTLHQDHLEPRTLSRFFGLLAKTNIAERPEIKFAYDDNPKALKVLGAIQGLIRLYRKIGGSKRDIILSQESISENDRTALLLDANVEGSLAKSVEQLELGELERTFLQAGGARFFTYPPDAVNAIRKSLSEIENRFLNSANAERVFWGRLTVKLICDLSFFEDFSPKELLYGQKIATDIGDHSLLANCHRFANQPYGLGEEAYAVLQNAVNFFDRIPENSEEFLTWAGPKFSSRQNKNTTAFFQKDIVIDPSQMLADYHEAISVFPTYGNLGMLGNAAGCAFLFEGKFDDAVKTFEDAEIRGGLPIDLMNIRVNKVISKALATQETSDFELNNLANFIARSDFGPNKNYQRLRAADNLLRVSYLERKTHDILHIFIDSDLGSFFDSDNLFQGQDYLFRTRLNHYNVNGNMPGIFGRFHFETGFNPSMDKDWT